MKLFSKSLLTVVAIGATAGVVATMAKADTIQASDKEL